ncbi:MAG: arginine--tRNA ligase [Acidimicrobiales bacterium]
MTVVDNVLDWLDERLGSAGAGDEVVASTPDRPDGETDAVLLVRHAEWGASEAGQQALEAVVGSGACRVLRRDGTRIRLRLDSALLRELAERLEAGEPDPLRTRELAAGRSWVVNFIDPNTTKALHIGHLRNIAVGHSLGCVGEAAGIDVTRQVRLGDYGRSVGEAMAGYLAYGEGATPERSGMAGDRLVGECYSRYVAALGPQPEIPFEDTALTREVHVAKDVADELLDRWSTGDEEAVHLFETLRRWVLDGHAATCSRLGVHVDRILFESELLDRASAIVERGLEEGFIRRAESGAIVYDTGDPEYERFLLCRTDGFPTQHLRYIATWSSTRDLYQDAHTINVLGIEWRHMVKYTAAIIAELHPPGERHPDVDIVHEMVVSDTGVIKSSKGNAVLIEDILDEIVGCEAMAQLQKRHDRVTPEEVAPLVALARFLADPANRRITMRPDAFVDVEAPGWVLAEAWARAWEAGSDGPPDPDLEDADYRYLVLRSAVHRRLLANCIEREEVLPLVRFHLHLARWYTTTTPNPRLDRAMRSVIGEGLVALGLHPTGVPRLEDLQAA